MLTIEKIKKDFSHIEAWTGNSEVYHNSRIFQGYGNLCDLYFKSNDRQIKQDQIEKYNEFEENFKSYLPDIEKYILSSLKNSEVKLENTLRQSKLTLDVIEIPFDSQKYDLVLVCGKTYKNFFFLTKYIDIRVEFKNGRIKSIQRKKDTTKDNE